MLLIDTIILRLKNPLPVASFHDFQSLSSKRLTLGGELYKLKHDYDGLAFYDWLQFDGRNVEGIQWSAISQNKLVGHYAKARSLRYVRQVGQYYRISFSKPPDELEIKLDAVQDFGNNLLWQSVSGTLAISFSLSFLRIMEVRHLMDTLRVDVMKDS